MRLYFHPASTTSRMVWQFALDQGVELEYKVVDLFTGEHMQPPFAKINASMMVPVLEDGDFLLSESSSILKYLADKVSSPAYPKELKSRARVNEMMDWFNANLYKDLGYGVVYPQAFPHHQRPGEAVQAGTLAWGKQKTQHWLKILDESLIGPNRPYLCGDQITLADYLGAEMIYVGKLVRCDYSGWRNISRWMGNMGALKTWPQVHQTIDGFAASLKDKPFVAV